MQFGLRVGITKGQGTRTCTRGGCLRLKAVQGLPETYPQMSTVGNGALTDGVVPVTAAVCRCRVRIIIQSCTTTTGYLGFVPLPVAWVRVRETLYSVLTFQLSEYVVSGIPVVLRRLAYYSFHLVVQAHRGTTQIRTPCFFCQNFARVCKRVGCVIDLGQSVKAMRGRNRGNMSCFRYFLTSPIFYSAPEGRTRYT